MLNKTDNTLSDNAFYLEYSNAGTSKTYNLHFTFTSVINAEKFFLMTSNYQLPVERIDNQVIILPTTDESNPGIWIHSDDLVLLNFGEDAGHDSALELIKFINEHHANGYFTKINNFKGETDSKIVESDFLFFKPQLFQSKFSLVERINITRKYNHSAFVLFALNNLFETNSILPHELISIIMMHFNWEKMDEAFFKLNQTYPLPAKIRESHKKIDCFLECDEHKDIFHLICTNSTESRQLYHQFNKNTHRLNIKYYHHELLIKSIETPNYDDSKEYANFGTTRHQARFFYDSINFYVKTKDNPALELHCDEQPRRVIMIPKETIRIRTDEEIAIFKEVIYPILDFIEYRIIGKMKDDLNEQTKPQENTLCGFFGDNNLTTRMDERIKTMQIACFRNLVDKIREGLRIRTRLEEIIDHWYQSILPKTSGQTVYEIMHLDGENNPCNSTPSSESIHTLLTTFSEKCKTVLAKTGCDVETLNDYSSGFKFDPAQSTR